MLCKPIVTYWKCGDPCLKIDTLEARIEKNPPNFNVIRTRNITDDFISFCKRYDNLYLHILISGLNQTIFEPKIPSVKNMFFRMKQLIDQGFMQSRILVSVEPIIPNDNGIRILELILRLFSEFNALRLRTIRFRPLHYREFSTEKYSTTDISNKNITKRYEINDVRPYLQKTDSFFKEYYKLIEKYKSIITVDTEEHVIGIRELMAFGMKNEWLDETTDPPTKKKIITYNRLKVPDVKIISGYTRCKNKCLLCPHVG